MREIKELREAEILSSLLQPTLRHFRRGLRERRRVEGDRRIVRIAANNSPPGTPGRPSLRIRTRRSADVAAHSLEETDESLVRLGRDHAREFLVELAVLIDR